VLLHRTSGPGGERAEPATRPSAGNSGAGRPEWSSIGCRAPKRMNREEFFAKFAGLDEDRISKALWNLYWRGSAQMRERIESELEPAEDAARKRAAAEPPDPDTVLFEVCEFAELARAGAYMAGDRRVSPRERTRWRLTFRLPGRK
jgi:hypothetical protein